MLLRHTLFAALALLAACSPPAAQPPADTTGVPATAVPITDREAFMAAQRPQAPHARFQALVGQWAYRDSTTTTTLQADTFVSAGWLRLRLYTDSILQQEAHLGYDNLRQMYTLWVMHAHSVTTQFYTGQWHAATSELLLQRTGIVLANGQQEAFHVRLHLKPSPGSLHWLQEERWQNPAIRGGVWQTQNEFTFTPMR